MDKRFFIDSEIKINIGDKVVLMGDEHMHLAKVMRLRAGDNVECFQDGSEIFGCKILQVGKNDTTLEVLNSYPRTANPKIKITLFQGLPKLDKLELISQKLCEIGVSEIVPFYSKFCIAKPNDNKVERLRKIVISACKQCGRTRLLRVNLPVKLQEIVPMFDDYDYVLFANEKEDVKRIDKAIFEISQSKNKDISIAYVVGSEGGFSEDEIELLSKFCSSVSFGKRILRTETASIFVASLLCGMLEV